MRSIGKAAAVEMKRCAAEYIYGMTVDLFLYLLMAYTTDGLPKKSPHIFPRARWRQGRPNHFVPDLQTTLPAVQWTRLINAPDLFFVPFPNRQTVSKGAPVPLLWTVAADECFFSALFMYNEARSMCNSVFFFFFFPPDKMASRARWRIHSFVSDFRLLC